MHTLNKVQLIGNVGQSPEIKTYNGTKIANLTLATQYGIKQQDGSYENRTDWHDITFFGNKAKVIEQYVLKGSKIFVSGSLRKETWKNAQDETRSRVKVYGMNLILLDNKPNEQMPVEADDDLPF